MTFDKTWRLALLGSNRFSGNFAGRVGWSRIQIPPRKVFLPEFPCGGDEPTGQGDA